MPNLSRIAVLICVFSVVCKTASADVAYNVTLDTTPLVGHPAGPFYVYAAFTDGSGVDDANNTVTLTDFNFGGGSALGGPVVFGGATGSLETGVSITDSSFINLFSEQFAPGLQLSFNLDLTLNDDAGGTPDRLTFYILDSSGVALPTLAPSGDYFFGVDIHSAGPIFDAYGSDPSRTPTVGGAVSISAPSITQISAVPEPSTVWLLACTPLMIAALTLCSLRRRRLSSSPRKL